MRKSHENQSWPEGNGTWKQQLAALPRFPGRWAQRTVPCLAMRTPASAGIGRHRQAGGSARTKPGAGAPSRQQEVWISASSPGLTRSSLCLMPVCSIYWPCPVLQPSLLKAAHLQVSCKYSGIHLVVKVWILFFFKKRSKDYWKGLKEGCCGSN